MHFDTASAMRGRFSNPRSLTNVTRHTLISSSSFYSSSGAAGGRGGGRGRGSSGPSSFDFGSPVPGKPEPADDPNSESFQSPFPSGLGHGRGKPLPQPSAPTLPSFSPFASTGSGRGRGRLTPHPTDSVPQTSPDFSPRKPIFFSKEDTADSEQKPQSQPSWLSSEELKNLPPSVLSAFPGGAGAGRGKPLNQPPSPPSQAENRHLRLGRQPVSRPPQPRLSQEEAVKKAVDVLSRGGGGEQGGRGRGLRERGRGRGRGKGRGRGRGRRGQEGDAHEEYAGLFLGDNADGEKFGNKIGLENMSKLDEAFEEMSGRVLPSPLEDAYLDALHTNCSVKF